MKSISIFATNTFYMASIIIDYDGRNTIIKKLIELITLSGGKVRKTEVNSIDQSLEDFECGRVTHCEDFDDFLHKINNSH